MKSTNILFITGTAQHPETLVMFDLLWKYYEKTRNYAAAAKILAKLADRHSTEINLQQRIEYLSRAIICVKSGEICMESHRGGMYRISQFFVEFSISRKNNFFWSIFRYWSITPRFGGKNGGRQSPTSSS